MYLIIELICLQQDNLEKFKFSYTEPKLVRYAWQEECMNGFFLPGWEFAPADLVADN